MDIQRLLGKDQYDAAMNSSSPSAVNPFVTIADVDGVYVPLAGTAPGVPITGTRVMQDTFFPAPAINIVENEISGNSKIRFFQQGLTPMDGAIANAPVLTGFAYSIFSGFDVSSFYPIGTTIIIQNTQSGNNDGVHTITGIHWDGVTNWIQWAGMTTELSAPYGDWGQLQEGMEFSSYDSGLDQTNGFFCTPQYGRFFMRRGTYGQPGYYNTEVAIADNIAGDVGGFFTYQSVPITIGARDWTVRQGVVNSVASGGRQANVKTDYTTYTENLALHRSSGGTETLISADKTTNVDRAVLIQDRDGTLSYIDQIGGQNVNANITAPAVGQDGYIVSWDNGAGEYVLVPDAVGSTPTLSAVLTAGDTGTLGQNINLVGGVLDMQNAGTISGGPTCDQGGLTITPGAGGTTITTYSCRPTLAQDLNLSVGQIGAFVTLQSGTLGDGVFKVIGNGEATFQANLSGTNRLIQFQDADGTVEYTGAYDTGATYTATNVTTDRTYDADSSTVDELADVVGTLIADLKTVGIIL